MSTGLHSDLPARAKVSIYLLFGIAVALAPRAAAAESITVGLFAPSAPFPSTAARVELASKLAAQIGKDTGAVANSKVYARSGDFAAAVKSGDVTVALVDAAYLAAAGGNYTVIAGAVRGGETTHGWQLVARGADKIAALRGKHVLVPAVGGREIDFVVDVLLGGEVARDYFAKIEAAPDTASALAALALGKADAAIVPDGVDLPAGTTSILTLPALSGPVLVAFGSPSAARKAQLAASAAAFAGDATVASLRPADAESVRAIVRRFSPPAKRGPLAIPAIHVLVGDLVAGRTFSIERTPATAFVVAPAAH